MKIKILSLFLIISLSTLLFYKYMLMSKDNDIQNLAKKTLESMSIANSAILDTYKIVAQKDFNNLMKNEKALFILKKFKYADKEQKAILRGKLYRLLYKEYEQMKKLNVRQFHFHTHDGRSLLRFHLPYKSGDSLMELRTSIRVANTEFKTMVGFEGGRIYPGYRYVFPIIYKNEHLGSVEFSVSFAALEKKLKNILPFHAYELILEKAVSYDKVFKKHREFFMPSGLSKNYYIENAAISKVTQKVKDDTFVKKLTSLTRQSDDFSEKLNKKESFAVPIIDGNSGYVVTFLALKDIDKKNAGYVVSFGKLQDILEVEERYDNFIVIGFLTAIVFFILITVIITQIQKIKEDSLKLQKFIDIQNSIVILTDGKEFKFANKKFFDFFGCKNLEDFTNEYSCICNKFLKQSGFFSLADVKESEKGWIDSMLNLSGRKRIVSMLDNISIPHAFTVSINSYDKKNYVINFSDISDTMSEKLQLQKQVVRDQLTKAYNRVYFAKTIDRLIELNSQENKKTGIIFFDIDHFKDVNDTYGHQVGDDVLKSIVEIVRSHIRSSDKLIRWGGEEFIIVVPANSIEEVYKEAEHLRLSIQQNKFGEVKTLTCSFGISLYIDGDINESVKKADEKLYEAKESGRNTVVF